MEWKGNGVSAMLLFYIIYRNVLNRRCIHFEDLSVILVQDPVTLLPHPPQKFTWPLCRCYWV